MPIRATLPGYPIYNGSKKFSVVDMKGPVLYVPGGEVINASQFGEGGMDIVEPINKQRIVVGADLLIAALSFSGTYFVTVAFAATAPDSAVQSVLMKWYVTATGAEAGAIDLSAETVRLIFVFV